MADYLIINNNNSRTKFALASHARLRPERAALETAELTAQQLTRAVSGWRFKQVVLASVVPGKARLIRRTFANYPLLEITHRCELGMALDFSDPSTIGADRLANAAALVGLPGKLPAVAVDFGTAVTFDIVSAKGAYIGGIIAPGLNAMTNYLHERTALLPKIEIREPEELIGKSTHNAMLSGAVHGYRGLVSEILRQLDQELSRGEPVTVVATGGHAELISARIASVGAVIPDLTLEGIRLIANLNLDPS